METEDKTLQAIFDQAAVGIAQIGLDGSWLRVNDRYCKMLGYSESELRTKSICDITHPDDYDEILAARRQLLEGAISSHSIEKRYIRRDGTVFWGRLNRSLVRDQNNQPKFFIAVVEDITEKTKAEAALRDRERQLLLAQTAGRLGLWERDLDTGLTFTSSEFARLHGLTADQLPPTHEGYLSYVHPDDLERIQAEYRESIERTHVWDTEFRVIWPDGSVHWLLSQGQVLLDTRGKPVRLAGIALDITERKQAEAKLREIEAGLRASEVQLKDAQRLAKIGSFERRLDSGKSHWSDEMFRILGLQDTGPGNFPAFVNCVHPEDREKVMEAERQVRLIRAPVETEYRIIRPDGEMRLLRTITEAITNNQGVPVRMVGATQDITEQVKAAELLRASEQRLKNAERLAHVGHFQWDLRSNTVSGSDEMYRIFGEPQSYTPSHEDFIRKLVPRDRERVASTIKDVIEKKTVRFLEYQIITPNGDLRTIACTLEVSLDEGGLPARLFGACQDITDSRRLREELVARQKLEGIGVLAGGIAHDFNNLLGSILTQAELVEADLAAGLTPHEEVARIKTVAIRGAEIVRELMIYAGQDQASVFEPVDLSRLTAEMLELMKVSIYKHAVLTINLDKTLPAVWGNAPQIRQVLMNLVINASEAIGEKEGVIQVTTSRVPADDYVRLEVSDNGCGMTEEARVKIFDPFFSTKFAGRGLGLAVVQGIVRVHGGAIDVVSAPGQGATFQVSLPCASAAQNAVTSSTAERSHTRTGATVLVVEDEEVLRLAVSKALQKRGFSVMEAKDGSVAMDLVRTRGDDIDVLLLYVTLPGTSSREVFEEAQRMAKLKVVVSSAYDRKTVDASFPGLQITQFIRKPFQLDELASKLRDALAG